MTWFGRRRTGTRTRTWVSPVLLAVLVLLVGVASPGDARPGKATAASRPTIPPVPGYGQDDQITLDPVVPTVSKAKVSFALPGLTLRTTLLECLKGVGFSYPDPCPIADTSKLPLVEPDDFWVSAVTQSWVVSSPGPSPTYGQFPAVRVRALAFGSIPVTATVHLTQTVRRGLYNPLTLRLTTFGAQIFNHRTIYPGYGPAPIYGHDPASGAQLGAAFQLPLSLTGDLDVRLSDVAVDQVPVDVGTSCRTVRPAHLVARIRGGYYPPDNEPGKHRDRPGGFLPLNSEVNPDGSLAPAGWIDGTVDIPAFRGCHSSTSSGDEDLDPLVTGLISGPGNPLSAYASHALDLWCNSPLAHCPPAAAQEQQAALALARTVGTGTSTARVRKAVARLRSLQAHASPSLIVGPKAPRAR